MEKADTAAATGEGAGSRSPQQQLAEQTALYRFTDRLYRARDIADVYEAALDAITTALRCERASILLFDQAGVMSFVAWRGLSDGYRAAVNGHSPWKPGDRNPEAIFVRDIRESGESESLKARIEQEGIRGLAFIPLVAGREVIGKFMTYHHAPHETDEAEAALALTIARQLGFAVERYRSEEALRRNDERLSLAMQAGRVGLWDWNIEADRIVWTDSLYAMHSVEKVQPAMSFREWVDRVHPEDRPRIEEALGAALEGRQPYDTELRSLTPSGQVIWVAASATVIREAGRAVRMVGASVDITERKQAELQRDLLVAELSHRVKNTLATVISISRQSFAPGRPAAESRASFDGRIHALAKTHGRLAESNWAGVPFEAIVFDELMPYRQEDGRNIRTSGPMVTFAPKAAVTLGMALHELATNAAKYGALSTKTGTVEVSWAVLPSGDFRATWTEAGGPPVTPPTRSGFGRVMLERAVSSDLQGVVTLDFAPGGLGCLIELPKAAVAR